MVREIFLRYQLQKAYMEAMAAAQLLERMLVQGVDVATFLQALGNQDAQTLHQVSTNQLSTKGPMGPLAQRLRAKLSLPPTTTPLDELTRLIKERNHLAHDYLLKERSTVQELRAAICELRDLRRDFLLMGAVLMGANVQSLQFVAESLRAVREIEKKIWATRVP